MIPPVNTLRQEERTRLAAIIEMSLRFAGELDPGPFLHGVSHTAREIILAQYASAAILDEDGQTISGRIVFSGMDAAAATRPFRFIDRPDAVTA